MSRKQIINGKNNFISKNEKERTQNYTKKWINIINQNETNRSLKKIK